MGPYPPSAHICGWYSAELCLCVQSLRTKAVLVGGVNSRGGVAYGGPNRIVHVGTCIRQREQYVFRLLRSKLYTRQDRFDEVQMADSPAYRTVYPQISNNTKQDTEFRRF